MKDHRRIPGICRVRPAVCCALGCLLVAVGSVASQTFSNSNPIIVVPAGAANPYPSTITVAQVPGAVVKVAVTLNIVTHSFADDLDVLLVGPGGDAVMLMSDAGGANPLSSANLVFSQSAAMLLPDSTPIASGSYQPTDYEPGDVLPAPAPTGPFGTDLGIFAGTDPNGTWKLFVFDDANASNGGEILQGWSLDLVVGDPAAITMQPADQTVAPGETATFEVGFSGMPPFGFQWLRNGQVIVPFSQGQSKLTIANAQAANAGRYSVVVTNSANPVGAISSEAVLNVTGPLTEVEPPAGQTVAPGETVEFQVTAAGTPPLHYQWRLNGALIPGQTGSSLMLENVNSASDGSYSVTVWNDDGVFTTGPAGLLVQESAGPVAADDFSSRPVLSGFVRNESVLQGNNARATSEPDEPVLPGGGKSVWYEWVAPDDGIVTLNLQGSGFDTLLAVYTGTSLADLAPVTLDDDRAGFYTSSLQFNAKHGEAYEWMIDGYGFGGAGGNYVLNWSIETTGKLVPVLVTPPEPQTAQMGGDATFEVVTEFPFSDGFQWLFNGQPISGANGSSYTVMGAQSKDVGQYAVRVSNPDGLTLTSLPVPLNVGSGPGSFAADKPAQAGLRPTQGIISVGIGETDWNQFPSDADGGAGDPDPCNHPFLKTKFQQVHAESDGVIRLDTEGSEVFVLLGVFEGAVSFFAENNVEIACDVLNGSGNLPSVVYFNATQGSNYTAVVSPIGGDGTETIRMNATMGTAPIIPDSPQCVQVAYGGSIQLQVPDNEWIPSPSIQWRFNNADIPGATNVALPISGFDAAIAGTYSVVLSNFAGTTTNTVAHVAQSGPPVLLSSLATNQLGTVGFVVKGSADEPFALETAGEVEGPWSAMATNEDICFPLWHTNFNLSPDAQRFYRAVPWTPPGP